MNEPMEVKKEIPSYLDIISSSLCSLEDSTLTLISQISNVSRTAPPTKEDPSISTLDLVTTIGSTLYDFSDRIQELTCKVNDALERLEL